MERKTKQMEKIKKLKTQSEFLCISRLEPPISHSQM